MYNNKRTNMYKIISTPILWPLIRTAIINIGWELWAIITAEIKYMYTPLSHFNHQNHIRNFHYITVTIELRWRL